MLSDSTLSQPLVGYALGRSYGSAVRRNRLRRQLRELVKNHESAMSPGIYVFGASGRAHGTAVTDLNRHLGKLIAKCQVGAVK